MMKISETAGYELQWAPKFKGYELKCGDNIAGTLRFKNIFSSQATGETGDGAWTFIRSGIFKTSISIHAAATNAKVATFRNDTWSGGGTLELSDGRKYRANTNFFETKLTFTDEHEIPLASFRNNGLLRPAAAVEIAPSALSLSELPIIVILGIYLLIMISRDSASSS